MKLLSGHQDRVAITIILFVLRFSYHYYAVGYRLGNNQLISSIPRVHSSWEAKAPTHDLAKDTFSGKLGNSNRNNFFIPSCPA
jgi:hypothetical protein